jgi:hypothetical protein
MTSWQQKAPTWIWMIPVVLVSLGAGKLAPHEQAIQANTEIAEDQLLDVSIEVFDAGIPDLTTLTPKQKEGIYPEVRKSEARYVPMQLKETLQATGFWGAVRIVPERTSSAEVTVTGQIVKSTGKTLIVEVQASDISGREWLSKKYKQEANPFVYIDEKQKHIDPFSGLYGQIANDLLERRQKLDPEQIVELRRISELRFASQLAPADYNGYLDVDRKGRFEIERLPAENDPMMERVAMIRERDYMFVDTLNEYYSEFCVSMEEAYDNWRSFSYDEQVALAELRRQARMRKIIGAIAIVGAVAAPAGGGLESVARDAAMIGGIAAIQSGIAKGKEAKIHAEALRELAASFEIDVAPLVVEIEGETVRLTGNREEQYASWRELLRQIYAAETGLPVDPNTEPARAVEGSVGQ